MPDKTRMEVVLIKSLKYFILFISLDCLIVALGWIFFSFGYQGKITLIMLPPMVLIGLCIYVGFRYPSSKDGAVNLASVVLTIGVGALYFYGVKQGALDILAYNANSILSRIVHGTLLLITSILILRVLKKVLSVYLKSAFLYSVAKDDYSLVHATTGMLSKYKITFGIPIIFSVLNSFVQQGIKKAKENSSITTTIDNLSEFLEDSIFGKVGIKLCTKAFTCLDECLIVYLYKNEDIGFQKFLGALLKFITVLPELLKNTVAFSIMGNLVKSGILIMFSYLYLKNVSINFENTTLFIFLIYSLSFIITDAILEPMFLLINIKLFLKKMEETGVDTSVLDSENQNCEESRVNVTTTIPESEGNVQSVERIRARDVMLEGGSANSESCSNPEVEAVIPNEQASMQNEDSVSMSVDNQSNSCAWDIEKLIATFPQLRKLEKVLGGV